MLKSQRHQIILEQLRSEGAVRVSTLAEAMGVDPVTVRRDLAELERTGKLRRVHGGAVARESTPASDGVPDDTARRIAEAAAKFVPEGSVLFLGPGTLTSEVVPYLQTHTHLTVITNALNAAWSIARHGRHTLHVIGGQVASDFGIYGDPEPLRRVRADRVILEATGLDAEKGLTHDDRDGASIARALFSLSTQVIVVLPPERVGRAGALFIAPAGEVDVLITGREAETSALWDLSELGVRIVLT